MSEFQYYEFYAIDRELTRQERKEVDGLSSRFSPTARRALFTYSYSDFQHDEEEVLLNYFDFLLYFSNWGTRRLMFKFPEQLVDYEAMRKYICDYDGDYADNGIRVLKKSGVVLVDIHLSQEDSGYWLDEDSHTAINFLDLRKAMLEEDYRALFLIWLHIKSLEFNDEMLDEGFEIPKQLIPNNLTKLTEGLENLIHFFEVNPDWVKGAASFSDHIQTSEVDYTTLIQALPVAKKDHYLMKLLAGESNLQLQLKKEFDQVASNKRDVKQGSITLAALLDAVKMSEAERFCAEQARVEAERLVQLKKTKKNKQFILQDIDEYIQKAAGNSYDKALDSILRLKALAEHQQEEQEFYTWLKTLKNKLGRKPGMRKRLENAGL